MTSFKDLAQMRRSHRKFTDEEIDAEDMKLILRAALMSMIRRTSRNSQMRRTSVLSFSRMLPWPLSCWVILCRTTVGWKTVPLLPSPCSIKPKTSD